MLVVRDGMMIIPCTYTRGFCGRSKQLSPGLYKHARTSRIWWLLTIPIVQNSIVLESDE